VHVGHRQIDDQKVEPLVSLQKVKRSLSTSCLYHFVAKYPHERSNNTADSAVVVDHENARGRAGVITALVDNILGAP